MVSKDWNVQQPFVYNHLHLATTSINKNTSQSKYFNKQEYQHFNKQTFQSKHLHKQEYQHLNKQEYLLDEGLPSAQHKDHKKTFTIDPQNDFKIDFCFLV